MNRLHATVNVVVHGPATLDRILNEAVAAHEAFRKLGFPSDDIFMCKDAANVLAVVLKSQGKEFILTVGEVDEPDHVWQARWTEKATWWNTAPDAEKLPVYAESAVRRNAELLVGCLLQKGFVIPRQFPMAQA